MKDKTPLQKLDGQIWNRPEDNAKFSGVELAKRMSERGNFETLLIAVMFFAETKVGDAWNSGVSGYERVQ